LAFEGAAELHEDSGGGLDAESEEMPNKRTYPGKIIAEKQGAALVLKKLH
jgi:hypothetical protein